MDFNRATPWSALLMCALLPLSISQTTIANTIADDSVKPLSVTVKKGDTLTRILTNVLGSYESWRVVAAYNSLSPPYELQPGDELVIPAEVIAEADTIGDVTRVPQSIVTFTEALPSVVENTEPASNTSDTTDDSEATPNGDQAEVTFAVQSTLTDPEQSTDTDSTVEASTITEADPADPARTDATPIDATDTAATTDDVSVVVAPGDTLGGILLSTTGSYRALSEVIEYNKFSDPNSLEPGDIVVIPSYLLPNAVTAQTTITAATGDLEVMVRNGDTLSSILLRSTGSYESLSDVARYNNLQSPDLLEAGTIISIPAYLLDSSSVDWEITTVTNANPVSDTVALADVGTTAETETAPEASDATEATVATDAIDETDATGQADSPAKESAGSEQYQTLNEESSEVGDDLAEDKSNLSFEFDGILAIETERFDTTFEDGTPDSRNGSDLLQLRTNGRLNLTENSSIGAKLYNKPVDFPNRNEIFYFDTQDFYLAKLFYAFENEDHRLQIGKISVGDGFLGRTSTYYGNQITSKDYDEKIGINYFGNFDVSTYNLNYALSAFYDDTTRLSSSLEGKRDRNRLEDDIPGRTDELNNLFAGVSFGLGGSDSVYLGHAARSTRLEPFSHQDTWLGISKTIYDGESIYARVVGDLIHREDGLANSRDTSLSAGVYARASRGSVFLSLETERDRIQFPDGNAKFAELIVVYDITDNFFIEAAAKYEDLNTETTTAQAIAFIYYFEFDSAD